jgi:hypothetical protein
MSNEQNKADNHPAIYPGMVVAGVELKSPVNAKRIRVLTRRKNGLFVDCPERDGIAGIESLLFCLTLDSAGLADSFGWSQEEWDDQVEQFALTLPDGGLEEFSALFAKEQESISRASVEADVEPGKAEAVETSEPSQTGLQVFSPPPRAMGSTTNTPNQCPSSISSSTSTLAAMPVAGPTDGEARKAETAMT